MAKLIFEGDIKQLKDIASIQSGRVRKYGLKISLTDDKKGGENPPSEKEPKQIASQVADLISACTTLEALKQYESDDRQIVKAAYKKQLKELE